MKSTQCGRKAFVPTDAQRATVTGSPPGTTQSELAAALNISVPTLRKAFAAELRARTPSASPQSTLFALPEAPALPPPPPAPSAPPARTGRPRYAANARDQARLQLMLAAGEPLASVALSLGVSEPTLRRAYAREIETAAAVKRAEVLERLDRQSRAGSTAATKELLARIDRAGLEEIQRSMQAPIDTPKKPPLGKKEQAAADAARVLVESDWADILPQGSA